MKKQMHGTKKPIRNHAENEKARMYIGQMLTRKRKSPEEVKSFLMTKGFTASGADKIIADVMLEVKEAARENAPKNMMNGGLWCLVGLAISVFVFLSDEKYVFAYILAAAVFFFGVFLFFKGWKNRK